jgi:tripartite-type tricarboxylate transporter receptor subunit TctC
MTGNHQQARLMAKTRKEKMPMKTTAKRIAAVILALPLLLAAVPTSAEAAAYPDRNIRLIVPFGAGGSTDIVGRIVAIPLQERLGRPIVVENRGGAGGTVGTQAASTAPNDGYTLTVATTSTHVVGPLMHDTVKYDPIKDFTHIGMIGETPYVLVVNLKLPVKSVQELIDLAKQNPGSLNFGSAGVGSTTHLAAEMFLSATDVKMEHIPYSSNAEATTAVMSGEVSVLFGSMPAVLAQIRAGSILPLAVGTVKRSPQLPDVPTMQEAGVAGYRASLWLGLAAPAGIPEDIVKRLNSELAAVLNDPAVAEKLSTNGAEASIMTPEVFRNLIADELVTYGKIVKAIK